MTKSVLLIGRGFAGIEKYLAAHDCTWSVLRDQATITERCPLRDHEIVGNFDTDEKMIESLAQVPERPDAVLAVYENYILPMSVIAQHWQLPALPVAAAQACTDKYLMRKLFSRAREQISPDFAWVESWDDVVAFASSHELPLILKPANLAKSLLVLKSDSMQELETNYRHMTEKITDIYAQYAPHRQPKIVVEEYMTGHVYSTDAFVDSEGVPHVMPQIVDYQTGYEIGYEDNFHYSRLLPTQLSTQAQKQLLHVAALGCQALGMKSSPAHIEIIMTKNGPRIVEIGARNGGYRERMYRLANGIDLYGCALATALGKSVNIAATKDEPVAVLELFPKTPGVFQGLAQEEKLRQLSSLEYLSLKHKPGEFVGKSADGYKMTAVVILHHADKEQFARDLTFVNEQVSVQTTPVTN